MSISSGFGDVGEFHNVCHSHTKEQEREEREKK